MKKIVLLFLVAFLAIMPVIAQVEDTATVSDENQEQVIDINSKIKKEIKDSIIEVYGKENSEEIYNKVILAAEKAIKARPEL